MTAITDDVATFLTAGEYQFDIYSSGGAGTLALEFSADGTNYRTVDVSSQYSGTGSGGFILTVGEDQEGASRWKVQITGDTVANYFPVK